MRMQHYALFLQGFDFRIEYRKLEKHENADCMSLLAVKSVYEIDALDYFFVDLIDTLPVTSEDIKMCNCKDKEIFFVLDFLNKGVSLKMSQT